MKRIRCVDIKWAVLAASHVGYLLIASGTFSIGVFIHEFNRYFGSASSTTAVIASLPLAMCTFGGPVSLVMVKRFGYRTTVMTAGVLSSVGWFISSFATNIRFLIFTCGLLTGCAYGLAYSAIISIIGYYFPRRSAVAFGIVYSGAGVAILVFPPLYQTLIDVYGWRGACMIVSAFQFHLTLCGAVYREPPSPRQQVNENSETNVDRVNSLQDDCDTSNVVLEASVIGDSSLTYQNQQPDSTIQPQNYQPEHQIPVAMETRIISMTTHSDINEMRSVSTNTGPDVTPALYNASHRHGDLTDKTSCDTNYPTHISRRLDSLPDSSQGSDIQITDSCKNKSVGQNNDTVGPKTCDYRTEQSSQSDKHYCWRLWSYIKNSDISLFWKKPTFTMTCIAAFTNGFGVTALIVNVILGASSQIGITDIRAATIISIVGITSLIARLAHGWIADLQFISYGHFFGIAIGVCGVATLFIPLTTNFLQMAVISVIIGLGSGACNPLAPVVIREHVGLAKFKSGIGFGMPFLGLGDLLGPICAGLVYDATGNHTSSCYLVGCVLVAGGLIMLPEQCVVRWMARRKGQRS